MDLGIKKKALNALAGVEYLEADKKLLQQLKSHSHVFKRKYPTPERTHREVLWDLLSVANQAKIEANRGQKEENTSTGPEETEEQKEARILKEQQAADAAIEAKKVSEARAELAALDLDNKPNYHRMVSIVITLGIEVENKEKETLLAALSQFKSSMVIVKAVSPEEAQTELLGLQLNADTDIEVMQMLVTVLNIKTESKEHAHLVTALMAYRDKLDEWKALQNENEELQNENEELKEELESKEDELEASKKKTSES